jgi:hypothetical protein
MHVVRRLVPPLSEWVLYRAISLEAADLSDLKIEIVGAGRSLSPEQRGFLRQHIPALRLWRLLRFHRRGQGWIFLASSGERLCHYTFVTPGRAYHRMFSIIEPDAQMIGPCLTEEAFSGRSIYPRLLRHVVNTLGKRGRQPFYIYTQPGNTRSIRGMEKAGFVRCGLWSGKRFLLDLRVVSRLVTQ